MKIFHNTPRSCTSYITELRDKSEKNQHVSRSSLLKCLKAVSASENKMNLETCRKEIYAIDDVLNEQNSNMMREKKALLKKIWARASYSSKPSFLPEISLVESDNGAAKIKSPLLAMYFKKVDEINNNSKSSSVDKSLNQITEANSKPRRSSGETPKIAPDIQADILAKVKEANDHSNKVLENVNTAKTPRLVSQDSRIFYLNSEDDSQSDNEEDIKEFNKKTSIALASLLRNNPNLNLVDLANQLKLGLEESEA